MKKAIYKMSTILISVVFLFSFVMSTFVVSADVIPSDGTPGDRTAIAEYGTPTLDGVMDTAYDAAAWHQTNQDWGSTTANPAKAEFKLMWDATHVYVFASVTDSYLSDVNPLQYLQDSICIQLEEDGSRKGKLTPNVDKNFFVNIDNKMSGNDITGFVDGSTGTVAQSAVKITATGYNVEVTIPIVSLTLDNTKTLGFELSVNDADATNTRVGCMGWNSLTSDTWENTALLGTLKLDGGAGLKSASGQIEAESFDTQSGSILVGNCVDPAGEKELQGVSDGSWVLYNNLNFGNIAGSNGFVARLCAINGGGSIEIRDGSSTGTLLGTLAIQRNLDSDWTVFTSQNCKITQITGVHNICLVFRNSASTSGICGLNWIQFTSTPSVSAFSQIEAESYDTQSGTIKTLSTNAPENGMEIGAINNGNWVTYNNIDFGTTTGADTFEARISAVNGGGHIEVMDGSSTGTLLGTLNIQRNLAGDWTVFTLQTCTITQLTGIHTITLVFLNDSSSGICGLNWIQFAATPPKTAFDQLEAENFSTLNGNIQPVDCGAPEGGTELGAIHDGDWALYDNINFGALPGANGFEARLSAVNGGGHIEIREDSATGTLLGTMDINHNADWTIFTTQDCAIAQITGIHTICLVFKNSASSGVCGLDWFKFTYTDPTKSAFDQTEAENFSALNGNIQALNCGAPEGGQELGAIHDGDWALFNNLDFGSTGANGFEARLSAVNGGGTVEIRDGSSTGALLGTIRIINNADWTTFNTQDCIITPITGLHNICLVFRNSASPGGVCGLDWFKFTYSDVATSAFDQIQGENFNAQSGTIQILDNGAPEGGQQIGAISDGNWVTYNDIDFGDTGANGFEIRLSAVNGGGYIDVHDGSPTGAVIGTIKIINNANWTTFDTQDCDTTLLIGIHSISLVFRNDSSSGICGVNWFTFTYTAPTDDSSSSITDDSTTDSSTDTTSDISSDTTSDITSDTTSDTSSDATLSTPATSQVDSQTPISNSDTGASSNSIYYIFALLSASACIITIKGKKDLLQRCKEFIKK